jgi:hypothetical protein
MKLWRRGAGAQHRVLILVENMPVPRDRRVWLECGALVTRGYLHQDSLTAADRTMSSSNPPLVAAHWMISSVVPVKLPVTLSL